MKYKLYTTDGSEIIATRLDRVENQAGKGYRIVDEQGRIMFYKTNESASIMPATKGE